VEVAVLTSATVSDCASPAGDFSARSAVVTFVGSIGGVTDLGLSSTMEAERLNGAAFETSLDWPIFFFYFLQGRNALDEGIQMPQFHEHQFHQ